MRAFKAKNWKSVSTYYSFHPYVKAKENLRTKFKVKVQGLHVDPEVVVPIWMQRRVKN